MSVFHGTRQWIYAATIRGRFQRWHRLSGAALIGFLIAVPWIHIDGQQAVLIDLPARRFHLFSRVFTASDGFLLVLGALLAAFSLFLVSALFGRLWCGYLCPQTVFLEEWVRPVETFFEGQAKARAKRDAAPFSLERFARRSGTVVTLTWMALALSFSVLSWFSGSVAVWTGQAGLVTYALAGIFTTGMLADWLWFREQLCIYLCPYARFQSALTDDHSLMVAFDASVPIQKGRKGALSGACIDCGKCVDVCPQGIDIRDGFQLECINCARCVDACGQVMAKLNRPSLVTYTSVAALEGKRTQWIRPRVVLYGALVSALSLAIVTKVALHQPLEASVHRAPGTLFQVDDDGLIRNTYLLKIVNTGDAATFTVEVTGLDGANTTVAPIALGPTERRTVPLVVRRPRTPGGSTHPMTVTIHGGPRPVTLNTTFKTPEVNDAT